MISSSDTRPETHSVAQAKNGKKGVDVFIHEMVVPPDVWAMKNMGLEEAGSGLKREAILRDLRRVQDSPHTPQGAFGYHLTLIDPKPRIPQKKLVEYDFGFSPVARITGSLADPKYAGAQDQIDTSTEIAAGPDTCCENGY